MKHEKNTYKGNAHVPNGSYDEKYFKELYQFLKPKTAYLVLTEIYGDKNRKYTCLMENRKGEEKMARGVLDIIRSYGKIEGSAITPAGLTITLSKNRNFLITKGKTKIFKPFFGFFCNIIDEEGRYLKLIKERNM